MGHINIANLCESNIVRLGQAGPGVERYTGCGLDWTTSIISRGEKLVAMIFSS